jgi:sugar phosphate isomerase/epimerase
MQLCVSTYSLSRWRSEQHKSLEQALQLIAELGAGAVEFVGLDEKAADAPVKRARALRRRCEQLGLRVASYCVGAELWVAAAEQAAVVAQLKREAEVARELGAASMRHDVTRGPKSSAVAGAGRGTSFTAMLKAVVPALREVADDAQKLGVVSSVENHGFYLQTPSRVERLIEAVDHPNFGLTLDLGNFLCLNQDPVEAVKMLGRYAVMVHAKDFHVRPKSKMPAGIACEGATWPPSSGWFATPTSIALRGAIVGHGEVDVPAQLRLLKRAGYRGYVSLEFEGIEEPRRAVELGLATLRQYLERLS